MISAGAMRTRAVLQENLGATGALGEKLADWRDMRTMHGDHQALSGGELIAAGGFEAEVRSRFTTRYATDVRPAMRLLIGLVPYSILAVLDRDGRKRELDLMLSEGLNDG